MKVNEGWNLSIRTSLLPKDTNQHGTIFGGVILSYLDIAGAIEAKRLCRQEVVTMAMREVVFRKPVFIQTNGLAGIGKDGDRVAFVPKVKRRSKVVTRAKETCVRRISDVLGAIGFFQINSTSFRIGIHIVGSKPVR